MTILSNENITLVMRTQLASGFKIGKENTLAEKDASESQEKELKEAAKQFETIFIKSLLSQARKSKLSEGLFDTPSDDNFVDMLDQELAKSSSESVDIGIADVIVRQMSKFNGANKS